MKRIALVALMFLIGLVLLYSSRFWVFDLWPRSGLFGIEALRPGGGLLGLWLRGTPLAPFELLIWGAGVFLFLTYLQRFVDYLSTRSAQTKDASDDG